MRPFLVAFTANFEAGSTTPIISVSYSVVICGRGGAAGGSAGYDYKFYIKFS